MNCCYEIAFTLVILAIIVQASFSHDADHHHHHHTSPMTSRSLSDEKEHIGRHMDGLGDINQMAEDELRFLYFKMHDSDNNDRLDGCELIHSLLHWHAEECQASSHDHMKIFRHDELEVMIDPILEADDKNFDGFIDYSEFVAAQKARGF